MALKIITTWDDGSNHDLRLADLLIEYNLPAVFLIPTLCELRDYQIQALAKYFEIGGHTTTHPSDMKLLTYRQQLDEIAQNKEWLENWTDYGLRWFAYPKGKYNGDTIKAVDKAGFLYARTVDIGKAPKILPFSFRLYTTAHCYNRREYGTVNWVDYIKRRAEIYNNTDRYLHIWGHSQEIENNNDWLVLEGLFRYLKYNYKIEKYETLHNAVQ